LWPFKFEPFFYTPLYQGNPLPGTSWAYLEDGLGDEARNFYGGLASRLEALHVNDMHLKITQEKLGGMLSFMPLQERRYVRATWRDMSVYIYSAAFGTALYVSGRGFFQPRLNVVRLILGICLFVFMIPGIAISLLLGPVWSALGRPRSPGGPLGFLIAFIYGVPNDFHSDEFNMLAQAVERCTAEYIDDLHRGTGMSQEDVAARGQRRMLSSVGGFREA